MATSAPFPIGGYVLAGGRSSRMGTDKALLQLAGQPLIVRAVAKVHRLCADVHILGGNTALAAYAPLIADIHPGCGPIGGMEAGLQHSSHEWNLFLAVDMPFLPGAFIRNWMVRWAEDRGHARIRTFTADDRAQPGLCLLHKDVLPFLSEAILGGDYKLMRALESAAAELALLRGCAPEEVLWSRGAEVAESIQSLTAAQHAARPLWFANLNSPEDLAGAELHGDALDA